jgi:hypothetical protein
MSSLGRSIVLVFAAWFFSGPVQATPKVFCSTGNFGIDLVNDGCISGKSRVYSGVDTKWTGTDKEGAVEESIFLATGISLDISLYGKTDRNAELFSFSPAKLKDATFGTWTVIDGTKIDFITIKAASSYALYDVQGTSSGTFSTVGLFNNGGQPMGVSHMSFWVASRPAAVPEPGTLAICGAGVIALVLIKRHLT